MTSDDKLMYCSHGESLRYCEPLIVVSRVRYFTIFHCSNLRILITPLVFSNYFYIEAFRNYLCGVR